MLDLPLIRRNQPNGFSNGGWKYDRYPELESLDAGKAITVANLKGPGVIRQIHSTRHSPADLFARGVVLEIWFDDSPSPAVLCPLADFFGDGCNGKSMDFTSLFIECAPWCYNCYIPMPFERSARVILRNDTHEDTANYTFVEWEPLAQWHPDLGYFHTAFERKCFQLTPESDVEFLHLKGAGHILGRQFSVITDEPIFREFQFVMEGNNEVDIDGTERALDYLGSEDSFTFSWGFRGTFAGLRAGMPLVQIGPLNRLSVHRFHDQAPIRFDRELRWHINWRHEEHMIHRPEWREAIARDGCWVDYATVHYWYQDSPGGQGHLPLLSAGDRAKDMLRHSVKI